MFVNIPEKLPKGPNLIAHIHEKGVFLRKKSAEMDRVIDQSILYSNHRMKYEVPFNISAH